jgi:hypothetical protein
MVLCPLGGEDVDISWRTRSATVFLYRIEIFETGSALRA